MATIDGLPPLREVIARHGLAARKAGWEVAGVDEEQVDVFFLHDNNADLSMLCSGRWREKWETYKRNLLHVRNEGGEVAEVATTSSSPCQREDRVYKTRGEQRRGRTSSWVPGTTSSGAQAASHGCPSFG